MAQREQHFGVDSIIIYDPDTGLPYGDQAIKIVGSLTLNLTGETVANTGGSNSYPWGVEDGLITPECSMTLKEYPKELWEAFNGAEMIVNSAEAGGAISSALSNIYGSSALDATTGIASVSVKTGSESDLKTGKYVVKAVTATTVDIYALNDLEFNEGNAASYVDGSMKVNDTPLTITTGAATELAKFGIELNGGSGTIAMTEGDTATFEVRSINTGSDEVIVGQNGATYKAVGMIFHAQRKSDKELVEIDIFRAKGIGLPLSFNPKEFSESELSLQLYRDESRNGVYKLKRLRKA